MGGGAARYETAFDLDARAIGRRRPAGEAGPREPARRASRLAARLHVLFAVRRAAGQESARRRRGLLAARPALRSGRGAQRAAADSARVQQARRVAGAHAGRGTPRREARFDLRDRLAQQLAPALADAPLVGAGLSRARSRRHDQRGGWRAPGAARRPARDHRGHGRYAVRQRRAARLDNTREPLARLAATSADTFTIVAGSTWPSDEAVLLPAFADLLHQLPTARLLLAPHEPNPDHLAGISERLRHLKLPRPVRLSQLEHAKAGPVIVVDRVGILADLYALGDVAFVGGGFHRAGLHSVLEPAVFGVPSVFGPHWRMSRDATLLLERGGAVALPGDARHPLHSQWLVWHHDPAARKSAGTAAQQMVEDGRGASERTTALVRGLVM